MDKVDKTTRSATMSLIRSKDSKLERRFCEALALCGVMDLKQHSKAVLGRPDFIHESKKIAILLDSCFWHGCPKHIRMPASNQGYWINKIQGNRRRDHHVKQELKKQGWKVIRIWEHSIKKPARQKWWVTHIKNIIAS